MEKVIEAMPALQTQQFLFYNTITVFINLIRFKSDQIVKKSAATSLKKSLA